MTGLSMMDVQKLIGEVARRHNVLLDRADPIFVTVTLNELLLAEHIRRVSIALEEANQSIAALSKLELQRARKIADNFILEAARLSAEQLRIAKEDLRLAILPMVEESLMAAQAGRARAARDREWVRRAVAVSITCAVLGVATAAWTLSRLR